MLFDCKKEGAGRMRLMLRKNNLCSKSKTLTRNRLGGVAIEKLQTLHFNSVCKIFWLQNVDSSSMVNFF